MGFDNMKFCVEFVFIVIISGNFLMCFFFKFDYNINVDDDVEKLDIEIVVSLVYNFF